MTDDQKRSVEDTPKRFIKSLIEQTSGYELDPNKILERRFDQQFDEMIVVKDIDFNSLCEHHLLPFIGQATVGYIPNGQVVGLSKIPRLVDCFARRLQLQERMAVEIADAMEILNPLGVGVILEAKHQCMSCRGVRKQNASMVTSVLRGKLKEDERARAEFLQFVDH
jgi:GTP cyclohydrolase I